MEQGHIGSQTNEYRSGPYSRMARTAAQSPEFAYACGKRIIAAAVPFDSGRVQDFARAQSHAAYDRGQGLLSMNKNKPIH